MRTTGGAKEKGAKLPFQIIWEEAMELKKQTRCTPVYLEPGGVRTVGRVDCVQKTMEGYKQRDLMVGTEAQMNRGRATVG